MVNSQRSLQDCVSHHFTVLMKLYQRASTLSYSLNHTSINTCKRPSLRRYSPMNSLSTNATRPSTSRRDTAMESSIQAPNTNKQSAHR